MFAGAPDRAEVCRGRCGRPPACVIEVGVDGRTAAIKRLQYQAALTGIPSAARRALGFVERGEIEGQVVGNELREVGITGGNVGIVGIDADSRGGHLLSKPGQ